jgi:AhpD family alkylhydroperoxidase
MAFAFPVFTKLLHIQAPQARLLTYAIQSIGMSAASLTILYMRGPIAWRFLRRSPSRDCRRDNLGCRPAGTTPVPTFLTRQLMSGKLMRSVLGQLGLTQVRYVTPVPPKAAGALATRVYGQVERDFGVLAPPVALHSPAPQIMAAIWIMFRESLIVPGQVDRAAKEVVATAVSAVNTCPFCVTIHSGTLARLTGTSGALAGPDDHAGSVADPRLRGLAQWATECGTETGALRHGAACSADQAPELIGTAVLLHYLNRMVNVFLGAIPLPPRVPRMALPPVMRLVSGLIRQASTGSLAPGASLDMLPPAAPPGDLSWAAANPLLADGFARAFAAIDAAGARFVAEPVRELVLAELASWHGGNRGLSRAWAADAVSGLPTQHQTAGRLALLIAMASYQIDQSVIDACRRTQGDDEALIGLTSWASLSAARRVGGWIPLAR